MPQSQDLMGHGEPYGLAAILGNDPANVTAAGSGQSTAAAVPVSNTLINITGASGTAAVILPSTAKIGTPYYLFNASAAGVSVFPPTGQYLTGTINGTVSLAANGSGIFVQYAQNYWAKY
jgi:hypothetical protein